MSDFTVVVATFGGSTWQRLSERAAYSVKGQAEIVRYHGGESVAEARNAALALVQTEFVIFLDADDIIEGGYITAMKLGSADIRAPRVRIVRDGRGMYREPMMPWVSNCAHVNRHPGEACIGDCLQYGNWVVIGAAARTSLLRDVGGFHDEPIYEDWALWLRCWAAGATFEQIPAAIYRQHISGMSRNHFGEAFDDRHAWHHRIVTSVLGHNPLQPQS